MLRHGEPTVSMYRVHRVKLLSVCSVIMWHYTSLLITPRIWWYLRSSVINRKRCRYRRNPTRIGMVFGICFKIFSLVITVHCRRHALKLRSSWVRAEYTRISYVRLAQHRMRHPMYLLTSIHLPIQREQWRWRSQVFQCASIFYRFIVGWRQLGLLCQDVSLLCTLSFHTSYYVIPLHAYQRFTLVLSVLIINALVTNFSFNLRGLSIGLSIWRRRRWNKRGSSCWLNDICTQLIALLSDLAFCICLDCVRKDCTFGFTLV